MENLNKFVKRAADGSIDVDASVDAFRTTLVEYSALQSADLETVAVAVAAQFDKYPNVKSIPMPTLCSWAALEISQDPKAHGEIAERVGNFVRSAKSLYTIGRGRGGGVSRLTAEPTTPETV